MSININHNYNGSVTLQGPPELSHSTYVFPNLGAQVTGKILVSGLATIDDISGLRDLAFGGADTFVKNNTGLYCCAVSQNAPGEGSNLATGNFSIALGYNSCAGYNYQISHGVNSNENLGWKQSSQYICALTTSGANICTVLNNYQAGSDYSNTVTYVNGNAVARGNDKYATFDFCFGTMNGSTLRDLHSNVVTTGSSNVSAGFFVSSENNVILIKVSGNSENELNWLVCLNELKLKTS
jgi:hypothetical protein